MNCNKFYLIEYRIEFIGQSGQWRQGLMYISGDPTDWEDTHNAKFLNSHIQVIDYVECSEREYYTN